jgi:hypothetical protein
VATSAAKFGLAVAALAEALVARYPADLALANLLARSRSLPDDRAYVLG